MNNTIVRHATFDDDLYTISGLIYDTDPYIYPAAFGSRENACRILPNLMRDDDCIFSINNCLVAIYDGAIRGILVYMPDDKRYSISRYYGMPDTFEDANKGYFLEISQCVHTIYIACVSVDSEFRRLHIGESLVRYMTDNVLYKDYTLTLDVLDNTDGTHTPAYLLYTKCGFIQTGSGDGYSADGVAPYCVNMAYNI